MNKMMDGSSEVLESSGLNCSKMRPKFTVEAKTKKWAPLLVMTGMQS